jgi:hypothetical protein
LTREKKVGPAEATRRKYTRVAAAVGTSPSQSTESVEAPDGANEPGGSSRSATGTTTSAATASTLAEATSGWVSGMRRVRIELIA